MKINQLKAGALLSYIILISRSLLSIIYTPIMLSFIGQSDYGLYSLSNSIAGYLTILDFGLWNAVIKYTAKYRVLKGEEACHSIYGVFTVLYLIMSGIALTIGAIIIINSAKFFGNSLSLHELNKLKILLGIMVLSNGLNITLGLFSSIILAHEKFIFIKVVNVMSIFLTPLILVLLFFMGYKAITMAIVNAISNIIMALFNIYYCFKILNIKIIFKDFDKTLIKEILNFSFFIFLNLLIQKIYWSTDQIILGKFLGATTVAIYSIGTIFVGYFNGFSLAISNVFLAKVSEMVTKKSPDKELSDLFIKIGRVQYIIISFILSGFIVFGREFIHLWIGEPYKDAYAIALIILIPFVVPLIQSIGIVILQARNMHKFKSMVYFAIALGNIFLSLVFVRWWGAIGCALATAIAFTVGNIIIINFYYWKKLKIDIPQFWKSILGMSLPFFISLILGFFLNHFILGDRWSRLGSKMGLFIGVYSLLTWTFGMNTYEKNLILLPIKGFISRFIKNYS